MKKLIIVLLLLTSCQSPNYIEGNDIAIGNIYYVKDKRSNLCFALRSMGTSSSFTCVPCDSVKHLIYKK